MSTPPEDRPTVPVVDDDADVGRSIQVQEANEPRVDDTPVEEGPRRRLLVVLAAGVGALLLWLLFRSVPAEPTPGASENGAKSEAVEDIANASDPSWMNADTARRVGAAPGQVVPPVYGPAGAGPAYGQVPGDSAAVPPGAPAATPRAEAAQAEAPDPRREAFLSALRSKPLQSGASFGSDAPVQAGGSPTGEIPPPPSIEEMQAAAEAEAVRRSSPSAAMTGFSAGGIATPPYVDPSAPEPARTGSRSSYVNGGLGPAPQAAAQHRMAPRAAAGDGGQVVIPVGTIIEGQLHTAVNSDLPGNVVGMVTRNVYDATQRVVVVPMYSWLFGTYESDVAAGQARLVVQWTAIRFPSGQTYDLPALRAGDRTGASGLRGRVNNHYGTIFGHALLSSVVAAAFVGRSDNGDATTRTRREAIADATAGQLGQTASEVTRRNLNIKPTITVPRLTRFSIILDRDLVFTPPSAR